MKGGDRVRITEARAAMLLAGWHTDAYVESLRAGGTIVVVYAPMDPQHGSSFGVLLDKPSVRPDGSAAKFVTLHENSLEPMP